MCGGSPLIYVCLVCVLLLKNYSRGDSQEEENIFLTLVLPSMNRFFLFVVLICLHVGEIHRVEYGLYSRSPLSDISYRRFIYCGFCQFTCRGDSQVRGVFFNSHSPPYEL